MPNRPPRILPQSLDPGPTKGPEDINPACPTTFRAFLEDPDGDDLVWRVFVDYFDGDAIRLGALEPEVHDLKSDGTATPQPIEFTPEALDFSTTAAPHTVELFVADRLFSTSRVDGPKGRLLDDEEGLVDSFMWTVTVGPEDADRCS